MKVSQIVVEAQKEPTNEAPVSGIKQGLRKFGAKAAAKVGMKNTAMGIAGSYDTGDEANKLRGEFQNYMGQTGQNINKFDNSELVAWLKSKKYPVAGVDPTGQGNKKSLDKVLLKVVQDSKRVGGGSAGADAQPSAGASAGAGAGTGTTTGAGATATGSSTAPAGKAPPQGNGSAVGQAKSIPPGIQAQLDQLNSGEKKQLASML